MLSSFQDVLLKVSETTSPFPSDCITLYIYIKHRNSYYFKSFATRIEILWEALGLYLVGYIDMFEVFCGYCGGQFLIPIPGVTVHTEIFEQATAIFEQATAIFFQATEGLQWTAVMGSLFNTLRSFFKTIRSLFDSHKSLSKPRNNL